MQTIPEPLTRPLAAPNAPFLDEARAMACIHCGLCLGACPTYLETGNENDSPRGRIHLMRALDAGRLELDDHPVRHLDLCLGCRACEAVCPSGVAYGELLEQTREHVETHYRRGLFDRLLRRFVIERVFPHPNRMRLALLPARAMRALGLDRVLPGRFGETLRLIPMKSQSAGLPIESPAAGPERRGRVGFISGCVMQVLFGPTHEASVRLLNAAGYDVIVPREQVCCGALFAHGGNLEQARACARRNIAVFERHQLDAIVINAAGCGSTLKEYGHLLRDDPGWAARAEQFSSRVRDFAEWLVQHPPPFVRPSAANRPPVTFHDACHLAHAQRITAAPRQLLHLVAEEWCVELPEADVCCGSAGSYNLTEPAMAARLQRRKVGNILGTGAGTVVTTNPGCLLQIQAGLRRSGARHVEVIHLADYLARHLPRETALPDVKPSVIAITKNAPGKPTIGS